MAHIEDNQRVRGEASWELRYASGPASLAVPVLPEALPSTAVSQATAAQLREP